MARVTCAQQRKQRHKKILKMAKGYRGRAKNNFRIAIERVEKGLQYAYRDRRNKKRTFRALWIQRINAATRAFGMPYSRFIDGLNKLGVAIDRKILADMAIFEVQAFNKLVESAQSALSTGKSN